MKNYNLYTCNIERSEINGNYTVWLPEQPDNDFIDLLVDKHHISQGSIWEILLKVAAKNSDLDVSKVYFEPEGDVFVAYTSDYELSKKMEIILNGLVLNHKYLVEMVNLSRLKNQ